jgi:hypothetical protein
MLTSGLVRYFLTRRDPPLSRILLIESGARALVEGLIPHLSALWDDVPIDLVTCYAGVPAGISNVYRVTDYATPERRRELIRLLRAQHYTIAGMICSGEPIMSKWKWLIAFRVPAKIFVVNENGDYFWIHRDFTATMREFSIERLGLSGAGAIRTPARVLIFPFTVLFLLLYAFVAHIRRAFNTAKL